MNLNNTLLQSFLFSLFSPWIYIFLLFFVVVVKVLIIERSPNHRHRVVPHKHSFNLQKETWLHPIRTGREDLKTKTNSLPRYMTSETFVVDSCPRSSTSQCISFFRRLALPSSFLAAGSHPDPHHAALHRRPNNKLTGFLVTHDAFLRVVFSTWTGCDRRRDINRIVRMPFSIWFHRGALQVA